MRFRDRFSAGRELAGALESYAHDPTALVLALPRGGVPVGYAVARALPAPLDVFMVRKLGLPGHEELAMGAIASGGIRVLNNEVVHAFDIPTEVIDAVADEEQQELSRREEAYRGNRSRPDIGGRTVIVVDDGLATGSTMRAAVTALGQHRPRRIVIGVPVAAGSACMDLRPQVDDLVCLFAPEPFQAVGLWYEDFSQTSDEEIRELLARANEETAAAATSGEPIAFAKARVPG
jgi:putative phosphoribosyl transferase